MLLRIALALPALAALGYAGICALLYFRQENLIFYPGSVDPQELDALSVEQGFMPWLNAQGQRIGWKSPDRPGTDALLICHGNGGFALSRNYAQLRHPEAAGAFQVYLLEYPGYGGRPGPLSTAVMVEAAVEGIDLLAASDPQRRTFLLGQSLGTGIASAAAALRPDQLSGVLLITPFESLAEAAAHRYPWLPVRFLMRHRLDSHRLLAGYHGPVAFIVAGNDDTTPPAQGKRLHALYPGPKRLWLIPGAGHNDFPALLADWPEISAWLTRSK